MPICNRRSEQVMDTKMYAAPDTPGADQANAAFDPARLAQDKSSRIASIAGLILTLATVAMIVVAARQLSLETIMAMLPTKPVFWIGFALLYMLIPLSEWVIFHRLWGIPASGMVALTRKYVANEVVLGYLGEAKFYTWARQHVRLETAPFGAIKDVAILSAMVGNLVTLALLIAAWPLLRTSEIGLDLRSTMMSLAVVLGSSIVILVLRRKLFSLPRHELQFISLVHLVRVVAGLILTAYVWNLALPGLDNSAWLLLATLRMLVTRLPLIANKDLVFATLAMFTLGDVPNLAPMLAMFAALILAAHVVVGSLTTLSEFVTSRHNLATALRKSK